MIKKDKKERIKRKSVVICICGMAGSGKSTLAKRIAKKYKLKYYSGGDALKAIALKLGHKCIMRGWWESKEGLQFLNMREKDPNFDKTVDKHLIEMAQKGNVVLDSWTMPWLLKQGFKVRLEASFKNRAERIAKRDGMSVEKTLEALKTKEEKTRAIYKKLYGFDLKEDFSPFHLILDTDNLNADEVFQTLCVIIDNIVMTGRMKI